MAPEIVVIGAHGAGKTTLATGLAAALGVPFHEELGRRLAADPEQRAPGAGPSVPQPAFDEQVFLAELARDRAWPTGAGRVVETWHPGNLGYCALRSPAVIERYLAAVRASVAGRRAVVIPLTASVATLAARRSEPGSVAFFLAVAMETERWAHALGLPSTPCIHTDTGGPAAALANVLHNLSSMGVTP